MAMWIGIGHFHHDPLEKKVDNYTKEIGEDGEHHMSHPSWVTMMAWINREVGALVHVVN